MWPDTTWVLLDAAERRYVEEMGGMNLFFVFGSGGSARLVTPELSGSILPGVTRDSLLQLATDAGFTVEAEILTEPAEPVPGGIVLARKRP